MAWRVAGAGAVLLLAVLAACTSSGESPAAPPSTTAGPLDEYTDRGDACPQAVSAIAYADAVLVDLGQEPYQQYTDAVRSRLAGVAGTVALEARDWPDAATARQADVLRPLAEAAAARGSTTQALLEYRLEATRLVLLCHQLA